MSRAEEIILWRLSIPLTVPYKVSLRTYDKFEPLVVQVRDADGRLGWGEAEIHEGYGHESAASGMAFCRDFAPRLIGRTPAEALRLLDAHAEANPHAVSILASALQMQARHPALIVTEPVIVPLLAPVHTMDVDRLGDEVEQLLEDGFKTLKIKVGFDVDGDLARVAAIQDAVADRATLRLDANQAFSAAQGCSFAASLEPRGIELFEQPCDKADWRANAEVAKVSKVPLMLDESIYGLTDIDRAAQLEGVGFIKLKLKKLGGIDRLIEGLERIRAHGMEPVLGDGTATDIGDWFEACVARQTINNAGEMNGFLKLCAPLFEGGLPFSGGAIRLPPGYEPMLDQAAIKRFSTTCEHFM